METWAARQWPQLFRTASNGTFPVSNVTQFVLSIASRGPTALLSVSLIVRRTNASPLTSDPTSVSKCTRILSPLDIRLAGQRQARPSLTYLCPNVLELVQMHFEAERMGLIDRQLSTELLECVTFSGAASETSQSPGGKLQLPEQDRQIIVQAVDMLSLSQHIIVKRGAQGCLTVSKQVGSPTNQSTRTSPSIAIPTRGSPIVVSYHPVPDTLAQEDVVNVTGAGDTLVGVLASKLCRDPTMMDGSLRQQRLFSVAQSASAQTLRSFLAVSPSLSDPQVVEGVKSIYIARLYTD
jgi:pseudouridine-5'-phosphate glycosidase/pseudouridine kinase